MPPAGRRLTARDTRPLRAPPSAGCGTGNAGHLRRARLLRCYPMALCRGQRGSTARTAPARPVAGWAGVNGQCQPTVRHQTGARIGREDVGSASGPASVVLRWCERRVGGLGPGLTSESADAARVVLRNDLSAGIQGFPAPTGTAGLICLAWTRGRGFTGPTASGCVPPLNAEKRDGIDHRRDTRNHRWRGHPC